MIVTKIKKIKAERDEERVVNGKRVRVTVVERELTPEEQLEQRLAALEARVATIEERLAKTPKQPRLSQRRGGAVAGIS